MADNVESDSELSVSDTNQLLPAVSNSQPQPVTSSSLELVEVPKDSFAPAATPGGPPRILVRTATAWSSKPNQATEADAYGCWKVRDSLGVGCLLLGWAVMLYAELVVVRVVLMPAPPGLFPLFACVGFHFLLILALASHIKCAFTDPGAMPLHSATRENLLRLGPMPDGRDRLVYKCPRCDCVKPDRTHHCSVCDRCVRRMDHHCPWVNNCVGLRNQKYFVLFTFYIAMCSFFSIYTCLHYFAICLATEWEACSNGPSPAVSTLLLLVLIILCLLFGGFTSVMAGSQVSAILANTTGIERIKGEHRGSADLSKTCRLELVFGHPFSWRWLSPFHAPRLRTSEDDFVNLLTV